MASRSTTRTVYSIIQTQQILWLLLTLSLAAITGTERSSREPRIWIGDQLRGEAVGVENIRAICRLMSESERCITGPVW